MINLDEKGLAPLAYKRTNNWINMKLSLVAWLLFPSVVFATESVIQLASSPLDQEVIQRPNYSLSYNEDHELANWVSYQLGHPQLRGCVSRSNSFKIDPLITTGSSTPKDFEGSGYDRGHLLPAGDMKFNKEAMQDTFYMSNMAPQPANFNRGRWNALENLIRAWALKYNDLLIVTGPILKPNLPVIGLDNKISVPFEYYKVILKKVGNSYEGIGFLMSTNVPFADLSAYTVSINQLEDYAGVDFFPFLSEDVEEEIENDMDLKDWDFKAKFNYLPCSL